MQYNSLPALKQPFHQNNHIRGLLTSLKSNKKKHKCKTNEPEQSFAEYVLKKQQELETIMRNTPPHGDRSGREHRTLQQLPKIRFEQYESPYLAIALSKARFPVEQKENITSLKVTRNESKEFERKAKDYDVYLGEQKIHKVRTEPRLDLSKFQIKQQSRQLARYRFTPSHKLFTNVL